MSIIAIGPAAATGAGPGEGLRNTDSGFGHDTFLLIRLVFNIYRVK